LTIKPSLTGQWCQEEFQDGGFYYNNMISRLFIVQGGNT
jgi:hypothetical protein